MRLVNHDGIGARQQLAKALFLQDQVELRLLALEPAAASVRPPVAPQPLPLQLQTMDWKVPAAMISKSVY